MIETNIPDLDLDEISKKIKLELSEMKNDKSIQTGKRNVNDPYSWAKISSLLNIAQQNMDAGAIVPQMLRYPKPFRWVAKLIGRVTLYLTNISTAPQREFNRALLETMRRTLDGMRDMNVGTADFAESIQERMVDLENRLSGSNDMVKSRFDRQDKTITTMNSELHLKIDNEIAQNQKDSRQSFAEIQTEIDYIKTEFIFLQRRLKILASEAKKRLPEPFSTQQLETISNVSNNINDPMYISFEDQFRGTRRDIKNKLEIYLPMIRDVYAGNEDQIVLDVGCGRGEWLELLKENKLKAKGVDLNQLVVEQSIDRGLDVAHGDALEYLSKLPEGSLGAVTAFHLIEHLPHDLLIEFMDVTLRVLKSGGVAIFETPNPRNLIVGACNFYADPTHINPLFPETQQFLMEYRGFTNVRLEFLHPHPINQQLPDTEAPLLAAELNKLFSCERDYAVVGYKV